MHNISHLVCRYKSRKMKAGKVKITQDQNVVVRAKRLVPDDKLFKPLNAKLNKNGNNDSWSYESYDSFPAGLKKLCDDIFDDDDDKEDGSKINVNIYPPGCLDQLKAGSMSDKVGIFTFGANSVVKCEVNHRLMSMAIKNIPKDAVMRTKEIMFSKDGSYFVDGYPFALVSDYIEQSGKYTTGQQKGSRPKTINLHADRRNRWMLVFCKTAGKKILKKIIDTVKSATGKDIGDDAEEAMDKLFGDTCEDDKRISSLADDL
jgi:hypothetical protein